MVAIGEIGFLTRILGALERRIGAKHAPVTIGLAVVVATFQDLLDLGENAFRPLGRNRLEAKQRQAVERQMVFDEICLCPVVRVGAARLQKRLVQRSTRLLRHGCRLRRKGFVERGAVLCDDVEGPDPQAEIIGDITVTIDVVGPIAIMRLLR